VGRVRSLIKKTFCLFLILCLFGSLLYLVPLKSAEAVATQSDGYWESLGDSWLPVSPGIAYNSQWNKIVVFGGYYWSYPTDTKIYDCSQNSWEDLQIPSPGSRSQLAMTYDSDYDKVILFGGQLYNWWFYNDTWSFDLSTETWTNLNSSNAPPARAFPVLTYDSCNQKTILFGGVTGPYNSVTLLDTWAFDFRTNSWENRNPLVHPPGAGPMVHDPVQDKTYLLSSYVDGNGCFRCELWSYRYQQNTWQQESSNDSIVGTMALDSKRRQILIFGPSPWGNVPSNELWAFDLGENVWKKLSTENPPSPRCQSILVYDLENDRNILIHSYSPGGEPLVGMWALYRTSEIPVNYPPVAQDQNLTTSENSPLPITLQATDLNPEDILTYEVVSQPSNGDLSGTAPNLIYTPDPYWNGTDSFAFTANDGKVDSNIATVTIEVTPVNYPPTLSSIIVIPTEPAPINTPFTATATFSDPDWEDTHTANWNWGDGSSSTGIVNEAGKLINGSHTYLQPGVYTITLTLSDGHTTATAIYQYVVVYDPNGGFVTGGGWINSPPGAYRPNPNLTGKANFGFEVKYKKGATVPSGNTEFQFHAGNLNFHSTSFEWLVIASKKAQFKGEGTINGSGSYRFFLTVIDGQYNGAKDPDKFRIKIWDQNANTLVYDNLLNAPDDADPTTVIGGGNIVIHKP